MGAGRASSSLAVEHIERRWASMDLPCTFPATTYTWTESVTVTRRGSSSVVGNDALDAARDLAEQLVGQIANSMYQWLKELRCTAPCELEIIHIGPPSTSYTERIAWNHGPRYEIVSYSETATVVGSLTVDCHKPVPGQAGLERGKVLKDIEDLMKEHHVKPNKKGAKPPNGQGEKRPGKGTIKIG
jgi:hypothetical protein